MDQIFRMRPQNRMKNQHNYCQPIWPVGPSSGSEVLTLPRSPIDCFPKIMEMSQPRGSLSQVREGDVCSQARLARYWRQHPYACSQMLKPFRPFPFNVFLYQTPQPKIRCFAVATLNLLPNSYQICLLSDSSWNIPLPPVQTLSCNPSIGPKKLSDTALSGIGRQILHQYPFLSSGSHGHQLVVLVLPQIGTPSDPGIVGKTSQELQALRFLGNLS